jgi:hypothetical protein
MNYNKIINNVIFLSIASFALLMGVDNQLDEGVGEDFGSGGLMKINDYTPPSNPMNDRAKGYLLKGKIKNAITNYGNIITWDEHPAALWGDYTYLPHVGFVSGVPGQVYSSDFTWLEGEVVEDSRFQIWISDEAYDAWYEDDEDDDEDNFVGVVFEAINDKGVVGTRVNTIEDLSDYNQWGIYDGTLFISVDYDEFLPIDPNKSNARIGLIYPWALRPALKERYSDFDLYDYGDDGEEWTYGYCYDDVSEEYIYEKSICDENELVWVDEMDQYDYYGATFSESWFTRWNPNTNTDWQATSESRVNTHNTEVDAGDIFGSTDFTDGGDTYPLLAHSDYSETWPTKMIEGENQPYWPGWRAENFNKDLPNCDGKRSDPDCWERDADRFISDTDVYMEFDDRWSHRGNLVSNNQYLQTGYPMGLKVMAQAHSYGVAYAEDIMFVTVTVRNESGDWCAFERDENGVRVPVLDDDGSQICGEGLILPDGTKLNQGMGFDYKDTYLGFYMDADVVSTDYDGSFWPHSNQDDFMEYYWEKIKVKQDSMLISMAMIYDYSGIDNNGATELQGKDIGIVATQLLDSPLATSPIDLDKNGSIDIYPGEPLKMTDWHWFDWYNRPGVVTRESNSNCCAGAPGRAQALNKEEIQYKVIAGDTTNLTDDEKDWFFHTSNPTVDDHTASDFNPHFDSITGLEDEPIFDDGLDCVFEMSCGPFELEVGEQVPFSFSIIFGQDKDDLINNARFAQIMYNSRYQGFTAPEKPVVTAEINIDRVELNWSQKSVHSQDILSEYSDFEGFKVYKSEDGGRTWGSEADKIKNSDNVFVGWRPFSKGNFVSQFDLDTVEDSLFCVKGFQSDTSAYSYQNWVMKVKEYKDCLIDPACFEEFDFEPYCLEPSEGEIRILRDFDIQGEDAQSPWYTLGYNTGMYEELWNADSTIGFKYNQDSTYTFIDKNVIPGKEYTYSVTAYDMGVEQDFIISYSGNGVIEQDTTWSDSNPDNWATPFGYESIENSKGTTPQDPNFVTVYPGRLPQDNMDMIKVIPNPYIVHSDYAETAYMRQLRFANLPAECTITIFTVTGEKVIELNHEYANDGMRGSDYFWDLRTMNNQEVSPGLYLYTVVAGDKKHIGKFAVVR